ncbi:MAG TPA: hypothetical protein VGP68_25000 [Gemmataceae bacterium]|jgi:hypothetical protein|nr:hypothetical protein [Gemmataceae bacterium]
MHVGPDGEDEMIGVELERRAIHEAGHAGFAFKLGIGVQYVEIRTHNAGFCEYEAGLNQQLEYNFVQRWKAYILTQMGGMAAETRYAREKGVGAPGWSGAWDEDWRLVNKGIDCLFMHNSNEKSNHDAELQRLSLLAKGMIDDDHIWTGIVAIANGLIRQERLEGHEAEALYRAVHS